MLGQNPGNKILVLPPVIIQLFMRMHMSYFRQIYFESGKMPIVINH